MTWCDEEEDDCRDQTIKKFSSTAMAPSPALTSSDKRDRESDGVTKACSSCGHQIRCPQQGAAAVAAIHDLPGLPAGVKFDPTDQELLEHLEGKVGGDAKKLHPLIDEFIPTLEGENGICYTHPERLPGVTTDGLIRHFFHRPSKAYTTGTRKRRKVHSGGDVHGGETRWHKTGKTRPVVVGGRVKGFKKILVLYTNYGKRRKPEKTNWVMHQYHLGLIEEEKEGELVVSKVFYQTQPRQCGGGATKDHGSSNGNTGDNKCSFYKSSGVGLNGQVNSGVIIDYYGASPMLGFSQHVGTQRTSPSSPRLIPSFTVHGGGPSFLP